MNHFDACPQVSVGEYHYVRVLNLLVSSGEIHLNLVLCRFDARRRRKCVP